ncbi:MAG: hypothetical protein CMJ42_21050 [Phyllobacteriaceae bacterium]|nr:hypothetical protein [Phyllobacteriaceae bacterium]MBA90824.1 hypothetical protein [Phyllobacteriaceae bacterium]
MSDGGLLRRQNMPLVDLESFYKIPYKPGNHASGRRGNPFCAVPGSLAKQEVFAGPDSGNGRTRTFPTRVRAAKKRPPRSAE